MEDISAVRHRLWHSLEMHCIRRDLILYIAASALLILVEYKGVPRALSAIITGIAFLPFAVFYLWRTAQIFRKPESYSFYKATLTQPHQKWPLKAMYFTVVLEEPDGRKRTEFTHAIFACHGVIEPLMESYVNSTVTIALNKETGMVVVI